jgi:Ca-activated chloride channel family protein
MRSVARRSLAVLAALFVAAGLAADGGPSVRFVTPPNLGRVVGKVNVQLAVLPPEGASVVRVDVAVDGKPLATLVSPPWQWAWDAGEGLAAYRLEAVAHFSNGSQARGSVKTSPFRVDFVENVDLVNVYAVVRDSHRTYVQGLTQQDFRLFENGRQQEIDRFSTEWKPLRVALVLDTSLSMKGGRLEAAQEAALEFLQLLEPEDQELLVTFNDSVQIAQPLTTDRGAVSAEIRKTAAVGGTALYDAVYRTSDLLEKFEGRRVLVVLSDGRDESASGLEPGSLHTLGEALDRALRNEVMIFTIGFGRQLDQEMDFDRKESLESILRKLAENTGGRALFSSRSSQLRKAFDEVAQDLRHQYSLAYVPDDRHHDGTWRDVKVTVAQPGLKATARRGYYAPSDGVATRPARRRNSAQ